MSMRCEELAKLRRRHDQAIMVAKTISTLNKELVSLELVSAVIDEFNHTDQMMKYLSILPANVENN